MPGRFVVADFIQLSGWPKRYRVIDTHKVISPNKNGVFESKLEAEEVCARLNDEYDKRR